MRLIARYPSVPEAEERAAFLRSRGIATHVSELTTLRPGLAHRDGARAAVWAVLTSQYEDAQRLLQDPDHHPDHALDEKGMHELETEGPARARRSLIRGLLLTLALLVAVLVLVLRLDL
ncbi:MAG: hypothetical protein EA419_04670 [Wenzhouxiangella sp.]|nr:MAG: hypothetical protein EA419_04670 [Wenzhouxiangella sp.]